MPEHTDAFTAIHFFDVDQELQAGDERHCDCDDRIGGRPMRAIRWIRSIAEFLGEARVWAEKGPKLGCADCPIVMSCGLEPQESCLPRLEALAAGKRRRIEPADTMITDIPP